MIYGRMNVDLRILSIIGVTGFLIILSPDILFMIRQRNIEIKSFVPLSEP
jgi:hypothetical protein